MTERPISDETLDRIVECENIAVFFMLTRQLAAELRELRRRRALLVPASALPDAVDRNRKPDTVST